MRMRIIGTPAGQRRVIEWVALGFLGLAILLSVAGIVLKGITRKSPPHFISILRSDSPPHPEVLTPAANPDRQPAVVPEAAQLPGESHVIAEKPPTPISKHTDKSRTTGGQLKGALQLRSGGSVVVLAEEEAEAAELREDPGRLSELVESGLVFSAPNHTEVAIEASHGGLLKVRILDPAMLGKVGWVRADQVTAR